MTQPDTCPATTVAPAGLEPDTMPVLWRCIREPGHRDDDGVIHHVGRRHPADEHLIYWSTLDRGPREYAGFAGSSVRKADPGGTPLVGPAPVPLKASDPLAAAAVIVDRWQDAALLVTGSYVSVPKAELDLLVENLRSVYRDVGDDGVDHMGTAFSMLEAMLDGAEHQVPMARHRVREVLDHLRYVRNRRLTLGTVSARDLRWRNELDRDLRQLELDLMARTTSDGKFDPRFDRVFQTLASIRAKVSMRLPAPDPHTRVLPATMDAFADAPVTIDGVQIGTVVRVEAQATLNGRAAASRR